MQRLTSKGTRLCRSQGCTLPEFHSTGLCANHAPIDALIAAVDAELAPPIAAPGKKRDQARAKRKSP
jgi:hypothetical protein